jgi:hypothetical protein
MARVDLLIDSVRAGAEGNQELFRRALEAPITPVSLNGASRLLLPEAAAPAQVGGSFPPPASSGGPPRQRHRFPLPPSLSGKQGWRSLAITLGWFSPIHTLSERWRRADLWFKSADTKLKVGSKAQLERSGADWHAVQRGTLQHEIFEGEDVSAFVDGDAIIVHVSCREHAGPLRDNRTLCIGDYPRGRSSHWGDLL